MTLTRFVITMDDSPNQYVEMTPEEETAFLAEQANLTTIKNAEDARQAAKEAAREALENYDYQTAQDILEGETLPSAVKIVLKQIFMRLKELETVVNE